MKKSSIVVFLLSVLAIGTLAGIASRAVSAAEKPEEGEKVVAWEKLPAAVQNGLKAQLGTQSAAEVTEEVEDGFATYEAKATTAEGNMEVTVTANGDLLEREIETTTDKLPAAVAKSISTKSPNAKIVKAELVTVTLYEVELSDGKQTREIKFYANGQRLPEEKD